MVSPPAVSGGCSLPTSGYSYHVSSTGGGHRHDPKLRRGGQRDDLKLRGRGRREDTSSRGEWQRDDAKLRGGGQRDDTKSWGGGERDDARAAGEVSVIDVKPSHWYNIRHRFSWRAIGEGGFKDEEEVGGGGVA